MKVTNHHDGNYTFVTPSDSSCMYGSVEMTMSEFTDVLFYLEDEYKKAKRRTNTYVRDGLSHLFNWVLPQWARRRNDTNDHYPQYKNRICLGVTATKMMFEQFKLPRYKQQNYVIIITK